MKKLIIVLVIVSLFAGAFLVDINQGLALGAIDKAKTGLDAAAGPSGLQSDKTPEAIIGSALNMLLGIVSLIFLIIVVYGGITWMTAGGNTENVQKGRNMIIEGAIGLAITLGAYAITYYVVEQVVSITQ